MTPNLEPIAVDVPPQTWPAPGRKRLPLWVWDPPPGAVLPEIDLPLLYEDDGYEEMGENTIHRIVADILVYGLRAHLADRPELRVFANLDLHYHPLDHWPDHPPYVSPDMMVAQPREGLPEMLGSYRAVRDGAIPLLVAEVLSPRTAQERDLTEKAELYAEMGIPEYLILDPLGRFNDRPLELRRSVGVGRRWAVRNDADGGATSLLGVRVFYDADGVFRVSNAQTGERYVRPNDSHTAVTKAHKALKKAEAASKRAERERKREEEARKREEEARKSAEAELHRTRLELERLRKLLGTQGDDP